MTETRAELLERGWGTGLAFIADLDMVARMRCKHNRCGGHLMLETWTKTGTKYDKHFTRCLKCGHRKEF